MCWVLTDVVVSVIITVTCDSVLLLRRSLSNWWCTVSSVSPSAETPVTAAVHNTRPWLAEADQVTDRLYSHWLILASYWLLYAAAVSAHDGCSLPSSDWLMLVAGMDYCILIGHYRLLIGSKRWANICNIREPPAVTGGCFIVTAYTPSQPFLS